MLSTGRCKSELPDPAAVFDFDYVDSGLAHSNKTLDGCFTAAYPESSSISMRIDGQIRMKRA
jgi:hypothetical protein